MNNDFKIKTDGIEIVQNNYEKLKKERMENVENDIRELENDNKKFSLELERRKVEREYNRKLEENKKKRRLNRLKKYAAIVTFSVVAVLGIKNIYKENTIDRDNLQYSQIVTDMRIHAHDGIEDGDGHILGAHSAHPCVAPYDGETEFTTRLEQAMEGQFSDSVIDTTTSLFDPLAYGTSEEKEEAREMLNEIQKSLVKNEDGLWDSDILEHTKEKSK